MEINEVLTKLHLDNTSFGTKLREADRALGEFGKHGAGELAHVGSQAKALHKMLEQVTEQSELAGNALRIFLSPVTGTMVAAASIFARVHSELEKLNSLMDEIGKNNAMREDRQKAMSKAAEENTKAHLELVREMSKETDPLADIVKGTKTIEDKQKAIKDIQAARLNIEKEISAFASKQNEAAREHARTQKTILDSSIEQHKKEQEAQAKVLEKTKESTELIEYAYGEGTSTFWQRIGAAFQNIFSGGRISAEGQLAESAGQTYNAEARMLKREIAMRDQIVKDLAEQDSNHKISMEQKQKLQEAEDKLTKQIETMTKEQERQAKQDAIRKEQIAEMERESALMRAAPFTPTIGQLAGYNTYYGRVARQIGLAEQYGQAALAAGRPDIMQNMMGLVYGKPESFVEEAGIADLMAGDIALPGGRRKRRIAATKGLMDLLPKEVRERAEDPMTKMAKHIEMLAKRAAGEEGEGMIVQGKDNA